MLAEDDYTSNHSLPHFLSGHADEHEERGSSLLLNASIFVLVASLVGMAIILSLGNPAKVFADIKATLTDISALQPGTVQSTATIPSAPTVQLAAEAQAVQPTADAQALPPTAKDAPTRDEIAAAPEPTGQSQTENSEPASEALFRQFLAWAAEEGTRAQVKPVQPAQDAPAQVVQDVPAQVAGNARAPLRPMQKHRHVRPVDRARAEILPVQSPRKKVQREQNARVQVPPAQDARAQDQSEQNVQAPSLLQTLGWRN
jgi:hypothetical protein